MTDGSIPHRHKYCNSRGYCEIYKKNLADSHWVSSFDWNHRGWLIDPHCGLSLRGDRSPCPTLELWTQRLFSIRLGVKNSCAAGCRPSLKTSVPKFLLDPQSNGAVFFGLLKNFTGKNCCICTYFSSHEYHSLYSVCQSINQSIKTHIWIAPYFANESEAQLVLCQFVFNELLCVILNVMS